MTSGVTPESIEAAIKDKLEATHVELVDMSGMASLPLISPSLFLEYFLLLLEHWLTLLRKIKGGCGQMFEATIVSPQFEGKRTLQRHRLVNTALKEIIAQIHAWTPKCYTAEEWEKQKSA